jgi:hypothetical protein
VYSVETGCDEEYGYYFNRDRAELVRDINEGSMIETVEVLDTPTESEIQTFLVAFDKLGVFEGTQRVLRNSCAFTAEELESLVPVVAKVKEWLWRVK